MNKTVVVALGAVVLLGLVGVLVVAAFAAGTVWTRARAADDGAWYGRGMMGYGADDDAWGSRMMGPGTMMGYGPGYGMMGPGTMMDYGGGHGMMGPGTMMGYGRGYGMMGDTGWGYRAPGQGDVRSLDEATAAFEAYVDDLRESGLTRDQVEITEVMEFERNYYAIVAERDTGIGAMELLLDKDSGLVGPEPGPNMMWNAEYGHMGGRGGMMGMMGGSGAYGSGEMTLSAEEAQDVAQRWLDANMPGATAGEADPFYGYYTLHFLQDGEIAGMLSVHGSGGDVWVHSWHGDFVAMAEAHD